MTLRYKQIIGNSGKVLLKANGKRAILNRCAFTIALTYDTAYFVWGGTGSYYQNQLLYDDTTDYGSLGFCDIGSPLSTIPVWTIYWNGTGYLTQFYINGVGPAIMNTGSTLAYNHSVMAGHGSFKIGIYGSYVNTITF